MPPPPDAPSYLAGGRGCCEGHARRLTRGRIALPPQGAGKHAASLEDWTALRSSFLVRERPGIIALPAVDARTARQIADYLGHRHDVPGMAAQPLIQTARQGELDRRD